MRTARPARSFMRTRFQLHTLLAGMILLCAGFASGAAVIALPAGQVSIVHGGNRDRWRCETKQATRALCVRQPDAAPDPRRAGSRAAHAIRR